ncbi:hypothetical protein [Georgenia yuyongxinii]
MSRPPVPGSAVRAGLVSARPIPETLTRHAVAVIEQGADGVTVTDTSRDGWFGLAVAGAARPGARPPAELSTASAAQPPPWGWTARSPPARSRPTALACS